MRELLRSPLLRGLLASALIVGLLPGCKRKRAPTLPEATEETAAEPSEPSGLVVAFVYGGAMDDDGFNAAHRVGQEAVARMSGVKVIHEENAPANSAGALYMEKAVALRGASLVFATDPTHFDPPVLTEAKKHPKLHFLHCGGLYQEGLHPTNAGSYHGYLDEAFYVSGVVAAMTSKTRKLGFIASMGTSAVLRNINAFTMGARSVDRNVTTTVLFTGSWSDAAAETKAANALADKRVDVLAMFVKEPRTILETAERRGIYSIGVHVDGARFAPKGQLTAAVSNWERIYVDYVSSVRDGKPFPPVVRGGMASGFVNIAAFGPAVSAQAKKRALEARDLLASGRLTIFKGPLKNNDGGMVLPPGRQVIQKDIQLEQMAYLVEGVLGKLPE
jgi:basic membrane protein A